MDPEILLVSVHLKGMRLCTDKNRIPKNFVSFLPCNLQGLHHYVEKKIIIFGII